MFLDVLVLHFVAMRRLVAIVALELLLELLDLLLEGGDILVQTAHCSLSRHCLHNVRGTRGGGLEGNTRGVESARERYC